MKKHTSHILLNPRITEKGAYLSSIGAYVFNVAEDANKQQIAEAIKEVYKVMPRKVTIARIPRKVVVSRTTNRKGMSRGGKKAYVYLKQGETIEVA